MIDHLALRVRDAAGVQKRKQLYVAALAPLGYGLLREFTEADGAFVIDPVDNNREAVCHRAG